MTHPVFRPITVLLCGWLAAAGCSQGSGSGGHETGGTGASAGSRAATGGSAGWSAATDAGSGSAGGFGLPGSGAGGNAGGSAGAGGAAAVPCSSSTERTCAGDLYMGQGLPVDIHVMFDQSGSMAIKDDGTTMRLDAVRGAVGQFVSAPDSRDLGLGIAYFGQQPLMCGCTSCNPADYSRPSVPVAPLPGNAAAVMASLGRIEPTGETPTGAAIRGACLYTKERKQADAGRNPVILLVTDGEPKAPVSASAGGCNPTLEDAVAAARECAAAGIKTYVLGIGPALQNLHQIAQAGGTGQAYLVAQGGGADILKALNSIRQDAMIPCNLQIPGASRGGVDLQKVNVSYAGAGCAAGTTFLNVKQASGCDPDKGGWYYDDLGHPTSIQLCPASCQAVKAPGGQLSISVGCVTQVIE
jgi:hypothetical protein